jgi:hypothetical protein
MNNKTPRTPFSTPLSGSAREVELRLKNIFSGPKKRPPALFLALVFAMCIFCGNLVSCQVSETPPDVSTPDARAVTLDQADPPREDVEAWLLRTLLQAADEEQPFQDPVAQLMDFIEKDGWVLGAVFVEDHLENTLILGIMDKETGEVPHAIFQRSCHAGVPQVVTFRGDDGLFRLLYTFNGQENGQLDGQAGVIRFDGEFMAWEWPVEGDARYGKAFPDGPVGAYSEYEAYWDNHLALLAPGGLDVYTVNPDFVWGGNEPMWQLDHNETFYYDSSSAEELPMPIYFQSLKWLNETMEPEAGWRITSLIPNEEKCDAGKRIDCYTLWAHTDNDQNELTVDLYFPYEQEGARRSYGSLERAAFSDGEDFPSRNEEKQDSAPISNQPDKTDKSDGEDFPSRNEEKQDSAPNSSQPDKTDKKDDDWDWDWVDKWDEEWEKEQEAKQIAEYQSVGVTMDGKDYYYQGQLVNIFLDQRPNKSVYTLNQNPAGTVNVKILRDAGGTITGAAYLTAAETAELAELFED